MSYNVTATFIQESLRVDNVQPVNMYVINASLTGTDYLYYADSNQDIYGYELNTDGDVAATPIVYKGLPINRGSIKTSTDGEVSQVDLSIPNTDRILESYIQNTYDYLRGRDVYLLTTFARTLPAGLSATFIGDSSYEDYNSILKEKLFVDTTSSDENAVTFTCKPKLNVKKVVLPYRRYTRECQWVYLSSECDPLGNISGNATLAASPCKYSLEDCLARNNATQFGGFPSIPKRAIYL